MDLKMIVEKYPIAFQQIYKFSNFFFSNTQFSIAVILSKTPYLSASIALLGAKKDPEGSLKVGMCLLIPKQDNTSKWQHIVIEREELINGQKFYFYKYRKPQTRQYKSKLKRYDVGLQAKPASFFKDFGVVNHYANEAEWLGKHDIVLSNNSAMQYHSAIFPHIVGNKSKFIDWFYKNLELPQEELSLASMSSITVDKTLYSDISFFNPYKISKLDEPTIWIDKVPPPMFQGKALIFLSPYLSAFEEKIIQIGDLYQEQKLIASKMDCLPVDLSSLLTEQACYKISLFSKEVK